MINYYRWKNLTTRTLVTILLVIACCYCSRPVQRQSINYANRSFVDSLLKATCKQYHLPAMAATVVRPDTTIDVSAFGLRRLGTKDSVKISDHFHIGSNTKAMTAMMIAELVQEGKLNWNSTPVDVFPNWAGSINPAFRSVTLSRLLSHRAGIPAYTKGSDFDKLPAFKGTPTKKRKLFSKYLLEHKPANRPGTKYLYSNAGYTVATAMAEHVTSHSWKELMQKYLFQPLNINGGFGWPAANNANQPWGHWVQAGDTLEPHNPNGSYHDPILIAPAGDVNMSIGDYSKFLQLNLRGLLGMKTKLLNPKEIQNLHKSRGHMTGRNKINGYALGWITAQFLNAPLSAHSGSAGTFFVKVWIQSTRRIAVAVFVNAGNNSAEQAATKVIYTLVKKYGKNEQPDR